MRTVTVGPCSVSFLDVGQGPTIILAHCSSASHRMWKPLVETLSERYRVIAPDLIGYGGSEPWPSGVPFDPRADVDVLVRLARLARGTVHLAAHSYGGAVALEAARALGPQVASLTLIEPVAFHTLRLAGRDREWWEIASVAERVRAAVEGGRDQEAAAVYMGFWIGRIRWWLMPRRQRRRIVETVGKVAHEFGIIHEVDTTLDEYARLDAPTRLIVGGRTRDPARAVVEILSATLPDVERRLVPSAGHMSPFTHATEVHRLVVEHIDAQEERKDP